MDQIFGIGRYENWGFRNGVSPKRGPLKFQLFNYISWTHEIFKVTKYKKKNNLTKFGGSKIGGTPNEATKIQNFLTMHVRQMRFFGLTIMKIR